MSNNRRPTPTSAESASASAEPTSIARLGAEELIPPEAPKAKRNLVTDIVPPVLVFVVFILAWAAYRTYILDKFKRRILPMPWTVLAHGFTERGRPQNPRELLGGLRVSAQVALLGLLIAIIIGVGLAVAMSTRRWVENSLYPYAVALQTIPIIAIAPVINLVLGSGLGARTLVCVIISIFPIIINTLFGLKSADAGQHDLFTLHGASFWTRLTKLQFPAALPSMFEGFRISAGLSVIGAIVGEFFFQQGDRGLGNLINLYSGRAWYPQLFADIILCSLLGLTVFWGFTALRKVAVGKWYQAER